MPLPRETQLRPDMRDAFLTEIVGGIEPVVLRGLCAEWPVVQASKSAAGSADYLRGFDSGRPAEAFLGDHAIAGRYHYGDGGGGFNFTRRTMRLTDALQAILAAGQASDASSIYMGSLPADSYLPGFATANRLDLLPDTIIPRVWVGTAGIAACHYDTQDNLACVAAGRRRFTLYPPDAIGDLYVGPIDHTLAGQPVSLAAGSSPGDPRYPRFDEAHRRSLTVELVAGDALYLPKLWWHQVEALDAFNLLVNYWWDAFAVGPDQPYTAMMLAMITLAERPPKERAAWRAFFDHYAFRPEGHPLAHMPEDLHGILGPLRPHNYGRARAMIMRLLRGD